MCCSFSGQLRGAFLASLGAQKCSQKVRKLKPTLGPHSGPEIGFSDSALWPGNTNRKVKPVFGFNNEAQSWLQFSPRKFKKRDLASGHLQASDRSMISPWRPQQDSQPLEPESRTQDTGGQGDGCGGWTSAGAHTRPCCRWTGSTFASNSAG